MKNFYIIIFILFCVSSYSQEGGQTVGETIKSINLDDIDGLKVYPNPVLNGIIKINTPQNKINKIQIFDVLGKLVLTKQLVRKELNVSRLTSGVYILKVLENGKTATRKLVIK